jgi:hypothetical protein
MDIISPVLLLSLFERVLLGHRLVPGVCQTERKLAMEVNCVLTGWLLQSQCISFAAIYF